MEVSNIWTILKDLLALGRMASNKYKENPCHYLSGDLTTGIEIAYRIIALFEAHGIKRTQIYNILKDRFPEIGPSLDANKLDNLITGDLLEFISNIFGVRKVWLEGEDGPIYEPLIHYKNFEDFCVFVAGLVSLNPEKVCFLTALKHNSFSDDLYQSYPEIALYFSEPIFEIGEQTIYRYYPLYGPLSWNHLPARLHISAFFNFVDRTNGIRPQGKSGNIDVNKISEGLQIPGPKLKVNNIWHPEEYGYPLGKTVGQLKKEDWDQVLEYFSVESGSTKISSDFHLQTTRVVISE